jgi:hypothetical protein
MLLLKQHAVNMHGIAQLAFFNQYLQRSMVLCFIYRRVGMVLVGKNRNLARYKKK